MRLYFYSDEHLPIHIHFQNSDGKAKFNVDPVIDLVSNTGIKPKDLKIAESVIIENKEIIIARWKEFHGK